MSKVDEYLRGLERMNETLAQQSAADEASLMVELDKLWDSMSDAEQDEVERRIRK